MQKKILVSLLLIFSLFNAQSALAFNSQTRCQIIRDAIYFAPEKLQGYLVENFESVHKGIHHIDLAGKKDFDPYQAKTIYQALVKKLQKNKLESFNTTHRFGVLAGYLAETVTPLNFHGISDLIPGKVEHDGYQPVKDINGSLSRIIRDYRNPYLGQTRREVTDFLYAVAVNEIVDHWMAAWQAGGQPLGELDFAKCSIQRERLADKLKGIKTAGYVRDSSAFLPS